MFFFLQQQTAMSWKIICLSEHFSLDGKLKSVGGTRITKIQIFSIVNFRLKCAACFQVFEVMRKIRVNTFDDEK